MEVEQGTFTPLVSTTTGGMAEERKRYHNRLAELLAIKKGEDYASTVFWLRAKVSFALHAFCCFSIERACFQLLPGINLSPHGMECSTSGRTSFSHAQLEQSYVKYLHVAFNQVNIKKVLFSRWFPLSFRGKRGQNFQSAKEKQRAKRNKRCGFGVKKYRAVFFD